MAGQSFEGLTSSEGDAPSLTAEQARELTDRMKSGLTHIWEIIVVAHRGRAWLALGYASWDQFIQREFGSMNLQPPREEREQTITSLRDAGMSVRAIATATQLGRGTVSRAISSPDAGVPVGTPDVDSSERLKPVDQARASIQGIDGKQYAAVRPKNVNDEPAHPVPEEPRVPDQVSIVDELGEDAGDAASGSVLEMPAAAGGIKLLDLDANERGHREQARRDLREFHESGAAALPLTIKLASRVGGLLSPVVGESPLTAEEQAGVVTDSARAVRVLSSLLGRTAARPEALGDDPAGAEQVISDLTDAVEDLNRALEGWRTKR